MYNLGIILFTALIGCVPTTPEESAVQVCNSPLEEARLPLQEKGFVVEFGVNKTIDNVLVIKLRPHDPMPPVDLLRDSFRVPVGLILENRRSSGTELKSISKAPNLVSITFSRTELSASILEQLSSFKKLRHLKIDECVISLPGDSSFSVPASLEQLELGGLAKASTFLESIDLSGLENLVVLDLSNVCMNTGDVERVAGIQGLEELFLNDTSIDDSDVIAIALLNNLRVLELAGTRITDSGLRELTSLKKLNVLQISDTNVTNASIATIKKFPDLHVVMVSGTQIEPRRLQRALPVSVIVTPPD